MNTNKPKQPFCDLIYQEFEKKLDTEWDKYSSFGKAFGQIDDNRKINFYETIIEDIKKKLGSGQTLSTSTISRIIEAKKISRHAKNQTLDILCRYIGYQGWVDFELKNQEPIYATGNNLGETEEPEEEPEKNPIPTEIDVPTQQPTALPAQPKPAKSLTKNAFRRLTIAIGFGLVVWFGSMQYTQMNQKIFTESEQLYFDTLIRHANEVQFDVLLKFCPVTDSATQMPRIHQRLNGFYTEKGTARLEILANIAEATRSQRRYYVPPSKYRIIYTKCLKKTETEVTIETEEDWYLELKNIEKDIHERVYQTINKQIYILKKENNTWKIDINKYEGKARKVLK